MTETQDVNFIKDFSFSIPVDFEKAKNGEWRIRGLASTEHIDLQGEIIKQSGLDISPLKDGRGILNYDHLKGPENVLGVIDEAELTEEGLFIGAYLLKNCERAKAVYAILDSLKPQDKNRFGLSVEGSILRRTGANEKIIAAARISKVALTLDPVNPNTYASLVKSLHDENLALNQPIEKAEGIQAVSGYVQVVEPQTINHQSNQLVTYNESEVIDVVKSVLMEVLNRAITTGSYNVAPTSRTQGAALAQESMDNDERKKLKDCLKAKIFQWLETL